VLVRLKNASKRFNRSVIFNYLVALIIFIYLIFPIFWTFIASVQPHSDLIAVPPQWPWPLPKHFTLSNYVALLFPESVQFGEYTEFYPTVAAMFPRALLNSLIVSTITTLLCLALASLSAYAIARLRFPGKSQLSRGILFIRTIPPLSIAIPIFLLIRSLGLYDTPIGLSLVYSSFILPLDIWILMGYFATIPTELEEAALVDGCTRVGALIKVILPCSLPGIVATGLFSFMSAWNEFFFALILTSSARGFTAPVVASMFASETAGIQYGIMTSAGILTIIPTVAIALLFQKYIIKGLIAGAVKG